MNKRFLFLIVILLLLSFFAVTAVATEDAGAGEEAGSEDEDDDEEDEEDDEKETTKQETKKQDSQKTDKKPSVSSSNSKSTKQAGSTQDNKKNGTNKTATKSAKPSPTGTSISKILPNLPDNSEAFKIEKTLADISTRADKASFQAAFLSLEASARAKVRDFVKETTFKAASEFAESLKQSVQSYVSKLQKKCSDDNSIKLYGISISECKVELSGESATVSGTFNKYPVSVTVSKGEKGLNVFLVVNINKKLKVSNVLPGIKGTPIDLSADIEKIVGASSDDNPDKIDKGVHVIGKMNIVEQIPLLRSVASSSDVKFQVSLFGSSDAEDASSKNNIILTAEIDRLNFGDNFECKNVAARIASKTSPHVNIQAACSAHGVSFSSTFSLISKNTISFSGELTKPVEGFMGLDGLSLKSAAIEGSVINKKVAEFRMSAKAVFRGHTVTVRADFVAKKFAISLDKLSLKSVVALVKLDVIVPEMSLSQVELLFTKTPQGLSVQFGANTAGTILDFSYDAFATFSVTPKEIDMGVALKNDINLGPVAIRKASIRMSFSRVESERKVVVSGITNIWKFKDLHLSAAIAKVNGVTGYSIGVKLPGSFSIADAIPALKNTIAGGIIFSDSTVVISSYPIKGKDGKARKGIVVQTNMKLRGSAILDGMRSLFGDINIPFDLPLGNSFSSIDPRKVKLVTGIKIKDRGGKYLTIHSPIALEFGFSPPSFGAGLEMTIRFPVDLQPIRFRCDMKIDPLSASIVGESMSEWNEPFGFKGVVIRKVAIDLGIDFKRFSATGLPARIGALGYFRFPSAGEVKLAGLVDYATNQMILQFEIDRLPVFGFYELLRKGGAPMKVNLPSIDFMDVKCIIAPTGGNIGSVVFEPGFSFQGRLVFAGRELARAKALISPSHGFSIFAKTAELNIGPIQLGSATIDIKATPKEQYFHISAMFRIKAVVKIQQQVLVTITKDSIQFILETIFWKAKINGSPQKPQDILFEGTLKTDVIFQVMKLIGNGIKEAKKLIDKAKKGFDKVKGAFNKAKNALKKIKIPSSCGNTLASYDDEFIHESVRPLFWRRMKRAFRRAARAVRRGVSRGFNAVRRGARRGFNAVRRGARRGFNIVRHGARRGFNVVKSGTKRGFNVVKSGAKKGFNVVKKGVKTGVKHTVRFAKKAGKEIKKAALKACNAVMKAASKAQEAVEKAGKKVIEETKKVGKLVAKYTMEFLDGGLINVHSIGFRVKLGEMLSKGRITLFIDVSLLRKRRQMELTVNALDDIAGLGKSLFKKIVGK